MLVSGALMFWLLLRVNPAQVVARWQDVNWLFLALLIPMFIILTSTIRAGRLRLILASHGLSFPYLWLVLLQLKGSFILSFLPGGVSSDIYRSYIIGREADGSSSKLLSNQHLISVVSVLLERVMGLGALIFVSVASLFVGVYILNISAYANLAPSVLIVALTGFALALIAFLLIRSRLIKRWQLPIPFWRRIQQVSERLHLLFSNHRALAALILLSIALQLAVILSYFMVAQAMQLRLSLLPFLITVPVVELLISVPISVGGIGVRDTALVFLLLPFGVSAEEALSLSLLMAFVVTIMGILSGLSFFIQVPAQFKKPEAVKG